MEGFIFSGIFWGSLLILWGISIIIKSVFHVDIPIFSIILAFIFIYIGIHILTGGFKFQGRADQYSIIFGEGVLKYQEKDNKPAEYSVIFGKGTIDLTGISVEKKNIYIKANTIFGQGNIEIDSRLPVIVKANVAFASTTLPDNSMATFGKYVYKSPDYQPDKNHLELETDVVFGGISIIVKK
jgi:predicted membrane protein